MTGETDDAQAYPKFLDWLRYCCAWLLFLYGGSKLLHVQLHLPPEYAKRAVGSLTGYELTWYYYGYSYAYACVLGVVQVAGAALLLFRKTTVLGAAIIAPVIVNILLINIFIMRDDYGPMLMATLVGISLLAILWRERTAAIRFFWNRQPAETARSGRTHFWIRALIVGTVLAILIIGTMNRRAHRHNHVSQMVKEDGRALATSLS